MKKKIKVLVFCIVLSLAAYICYRLIITHNPNPNFFVGQKLDSLNQVYVYYNGGIGHTESRNLSEDGYNIGLKYQCVEFVKRYYYEFYKHKMPDSYGNAKDFFDSSTPDGSINKARGLLQYSNPGSSRPQVGDLVVFDGHGGNPYGHVAIVSKVSDLEVELIQQNPGPFASSRLTLNLITTQNKFRIDHNRLLGWLRMN